MLEIPSGMPALFETLLPPDAYPISLARIAQFRYKGQPLIQTYRADFICFGQIIVELKAVKEIAPIHKAQLLNYLKATRLELGLLVNFGAYPKAEIIRIANTKYGGKRVSDHGEEQ